MNVNSGVGVNSAEVCVMETGSTRVKRLSEARSSVLQAAWYRHRGRPEAPGVWTEPGGEPLQIQVRGGLHDRRLVSELRGEDALDAEVRHSASLHD